MRVGWCWCWWIIVVLKIVYRLEHPLSGPSRLVSGYLPGGKYISKNPFNTCHLPHFNPVGSNVVTAASHVAQVPFLHSTFMSFLSNSSVVHHPRPSRWDQSAAGCWVRYRPQTLIKAIVYHQPCIPSLSLSHTLPIHKRFIITQSRARGGEQTWRFLWKAETHFLWCTLAASSAFSDSPGWL